MNEKLLWPNVYNEIQLWLGDCLPSYLSICNSFAVYIIRSNQSEFLPLFKPREGLTNHRSPLLSHNTHLGIISSFIITYLWHTCDNYTCDLLVTLLLLTCNCIHVKFFGKLHEILFKIAWNSIKIWVKSS